MNQVVLFLNRCASTIQKNLTGISVLVTLASIVVAITTASTIVGLAAVSAAIGGSNCITKLAKNSQAALA